VYGEKLPMEIETIFDLASVSKVVATLPAVLHLVESGHLDLHRPLISLKPVADHLPPQSPVAQATIEELLTHTAGLPAATYLRQYGARREDSVRGILAEPLAYPRGTQVVYSNRGFVLLGAIVEWVSGKPLDQYVSEQIWKPLGMHETCFRPPEAWWSRIAPTEYLDALQACKQGVVHDENAEWLGGVAGHAGAFSSAHDLITFCTMILQKGRAGNDRILSEALVTASLQKKTAGLNEDRGLGWEVWGMEKYTLMGHVGFTGTGLWLAPCHDFYCIVLTNRVHPSRERTAQAIRAIRHNVLQLVCAAFTG
jgi:CubicO group peptidase (beta-lactamase class C family)